METQGCDSNIGQVHVFQARGVQPDCSQCRETKALSHGVLLTQAILCRGIIYTLKGIRKTVEHSVQCRLRHCCKPCQFAHAED